MFLTGPWCEFPFSDSDPCVPVRTTGGSSSVAGPQSDPGVRVGSGALSPGRRPQNAKCGLQPAATKPHPQQPKGI
jgi:hypothetical protein